MGSSKGVRFCVARNERLYVFFRVIPQRLNFICRRFGTLCLFHLHRQVCAVILHLPAYEYGIECSETSAYKIQTPGEGYPKENIQHTEHGESLKSRNELKNTDSQRFSHNTINMAHIHGS
jgi:hypothetical protein